MKTIVKETIKYSKKSLAVFMAMCLLISCMVVGLTGASIGEVNALNNKANTITKETVNGTSNVEVFNAATTLYDYNYDSNTAFGGNPGVDTNPYTRFNTAIQNWFNSNNDALQYPLYFGNFYEYNPIYENWNRFANVNNETANVDAPNANVVTQGLLNNNNISVMESLPYFNEAFLTRNSGPSSLEIGTQLTIESIDVYYSSTGYTRYSTWGDSSSSQVKTFNYGSGELKIYINSSEKLYSVSSSELTVVNELWKDKPTKVVVNVKDNNGQTYQLTSDTTTGSNNNWTTTSFTNQTVSSNSYGSVYTDLILPFTKNSDGYWEFNGETTPVYYNSNTDTIEYNSISPTYDFTPNTSNKPGYFPFDNGGGSASAETANNNYGFGTKIEIDFTLPTSKQNNGKDIEFNFFGDDDIWVFVDNDLVLDMGGAHGKAEGKINFTTGQAIIKTGARKITTNGSVNTLSANGTEYKVDISALKNIDTSKPHKLTIYYMERGMFESNMYISFNMSVENVLNIDNVLNTDNVNEFFKEQTLLTAEKDIFNYTLSNNGGAGLGSSLLYPTTDKTVIRNNGTETVMSSNSTQTVQKRVVYLDLTASTSPEGWEKDSPEFYAYFYNSTGKKENEFVKMTLTEKEHIYQVIVPESVVYEKIIFIRKNPSEEINPNNWSSWRWNQIPTSGGIDLTNLLAKSVNGWNYGTDYFTNTTNENVTYVDNEYYYKNLPQNADIEVKGTAFNFNGNGLVANVNYAWSDTSGLTTEDGTTKSPVGVVGKTDSSGKLYLLYAQSATFDGQFTKGSTMTVKQENNLTTQENNLTTQSTATEGSTTPLNSSSGRNVSDYYNTSTTVKDVKGESITYNSDGTFTFANKDGSNNVNVYVTFTNEVKTGSLTISKNVSNSTDTTKEYKFKVYFSNVFGGSTGESIYKGDSTDSDTNKIASDGTITLKKGESFTINNIPVGTKYRIVEEEPTADTTKYIVTDINIVNGVTATTNTSTKTAIGEIPTGDSANVSVKYTNKLLRNIILKKEIYESDGTTLKTDDTTTKFEFEVEFKKGGSNYTESIDFEGSKTGTITNGSGTVKITKDETITFKDVPIDVTVSIEEINIPKNYKFIRYNTSTDSKSNITYTFKNKYEPPTITINKYIDELYYGINNNPHNFNNYSLVGGSTTHDPYGYERYTNAEQSFVFKIEKLSSYSDTATVEGVTYIVLKFGANKKPLTTAVTNGDKTYNYSETSEKLTVDEGFYRVTEISDVAWRYKFDSLVVSEGIKHTINSNSVMFDLKNGDNATATFYNSNKDTNIEGDMSSAKNEISNGNGKQPILGGVA